MLLHEQTGAVPETIGGVYRVEAELGRGGMARVYRVLDERSGQRLALKRLIVEGERTATLRAMFEREYYTLVELAHPRIVRVFDYGLDGDTPYYTMELLEGVDSRETSRTGRLSTHAICMLLRDCASALALIHSRRMVHRDVSPRNLWCSDDGRSKLIDFGTLVAMGPQTRIAGTPPFVPPEAVYLQPLDGRCDLYGLGALAYFLLTDRNAYAARDLGDLPELWQRRPTRPDAIRREIPTALSDLVMAMLSLDPRGRPASAAEVFERLSAIGGLPAEDESHLAQAFLTSPKLVGRTVQTQTFRKRLGRALEGRGSALSVVAQAGLGRSRMLTSLVLEAKLMGATTLAVGATAVGSGPLAVLGALAERLFETQPLAAAKVFELAPLLGHVSPALHRALGEPALAELPAADRTRKLGAALLQLLDVASRDQRLVIAVDDVHRADGASLAVLAKLSLLARDRQLLLAVTCDAGTLERPPPALEQLVKTRHRIDLPALEPEHTRELLESLFGTVPGLDEAASWLHELSQGSPQTCMQYAQYLVDEGIARYEGGHWKLPMQLRDQGLPSTVGAMFADRIAELSDNARAIALGLVLSRDETRSAWQPELHLRMEDLPKLLDKPDPALSFAALDELLQAGVAQQRDGYYVLGQRAMVDALLRASDAETRKRAHVRLAEILTQASYPPLMPVVQLQLAGEHTRARKFLVDFSVLAAGASMDWSAMRISISAACSLTALEHWQAGRDPQREAISLRRQLVLICSVYDWSLARFGDEQIEQLRKDSGIARWDETDPALPPLQRVFECLKLAQQTFDATPEAERGVTPFEAVRDLAACAMPLSGAFAHSHDVARARALPVMLEPLRSLSPLIDLLAAFSDSAVDRVTGKEVGARMLELANRLFEATELPMVLRSGGAAVYLHIQAVEDARRGRTRGFELIDRLAPEAGEDMFLVVHGRWLMHAFLGHASETNRFRKQVEMITEDDVWRRNGFLIIEAELYALTGDLLNLKRTHEALAELAGKFRGLMPWLGFTRAAIHRLRGELSAAATELQAALALALPGEHRAWLLLAPAHAELQLSLGNPDAARLEAEAILEAVTRLSLDLAAIVEAERIRSLALAALADHAAAETALAHAFALATELKDDGLPLAKLYEAKARNALAVGDAGTCVSALQALWRLIEQADAPALINAYEALREESSRRLSAPDLPAALGGAAASMTDSSIMLTEVSTHLSSLDRSQARTQQALELLIADTGTQSGQLFLFDARGLFRAASVNQNGSNEEFLSVAQRFLDSQLAEVKTITATETDGDGDAAQSQWTVGMTDLAPVLLSDRVDGASVVVGVVLLAGHGEAPRPPRHELVRVISHCLRAAGDSLTVAPME
jgi:hypothetical protein